MRILSILLFSPPSKLYGGAERQMHSLHKGLLDKGIDVQVLASISQVGSSYQVYEGIPIWGIDFPSLTHRTFHPANVLLRFKISRILKYVKEKIPKIDLIQVTPFREPAFWGYWLSQHLKVPWLARVAGSGQNGDINYLTNCLSRNVITKRLIPLLIKTCSAVVAIDDETFKETINIGFQRDKVIVISNSVVLNQIPSVEIAQKIPEDGTFLFLGRVAPGKRVCDLLKAYSICKGKKFGIPRLTVVGGGDVNYLRDIKKSLADEDNIVILGQQENIEQFLRKAVCLINPSESEGFPNSVMEACAFGVPSILSDIPIHREIAKQTGMEEFLFPVGDETKLCERILRYLSLEEEEVIQKRIRSFHFAQGFRKESRDEAYCTLYDRIVKAYDVQNRESKEGN